MNSSLDVEVDLPAEIICSSCTEQDNVGMNNYQEFLLTSPNIITQYSDRYQKDWESADVIIKSVFYELLKSKQKERSNLLKKLKKLKLSYSEQMYNRILLLKEMTEEEHPNEQLISVDSLEGFISFFEINNNIKYPDITLSPNGNIVSEWTVDKMHYLSIEFKSAMTSKYILFSPDPLLNNKVARISAITSIISIMKSIEPYNVKSWILE